MTYVENAATQKSELLMGVEPMTSSLANATAQERVKGIEPSQPAWKAGALPLSYTR